MWILSFSFFSSLIAILKSLQLNCDFNSFFLVQEWLEKLSHIEKVIKLSVHFIFLNSAPHIFHSTTLFSPFFAGWSVSRAEDLPLLAVPMLCEILLELVFVNVGGKRGGLQRQRSGGFIWWNHSFLNYRGDSWDAERGGDLV